MYNISIKTRKADVMFKLGMRKMSADKVCGIKKKRQKHANVILGWSLSTSNYIMYLQFETYICNSLKQFFADKRL